MSEYPHEDETNREQDSRQVKLPIIPIASTGTAKTGEVKRSFDFLITTPGMLRKGVARHGNAIQGFTDYNLKLFRSDDRQWALYLEWVDLYGDGHRIVLPHEVVQAVLQRASSIIAQARRERSQRGVQTRRRKQGRVQEPKVD